MRNTKARASLWEDGKNPVGLGRVDVTELGIPVRYRMEVAFVPGVQG